MVVQHLYDLTKEYVHLKAELDAILPDAPSFSFKDAWSETQAKQPHILCMRPTNRTSNVPLTTMHEAFVQFQKDAKRPFCLEEETRSAGHVASLLVHSMGDAFDSEDEYDDDGYGDEDGKPVMQRRSIALHRCFDRLFPLAPFTLETMIKGVFSYCYGYDAIPSILRVDKDEVGESSPTNIPTRVRSRVYAAGGGRGDPYMHISRAYHAWDRKAEKGQT